MRPYHLAIVSLGAALLLAVGPVCAQSVSGLAAQVRTLRDTTRSLARSPWSAGAETRLVDSIDKATDDFHALAGGNANIPQTADGLLSVMEETRGRYTSTLEAMQAEVIRQDGDLEAVQDSKGWRDRELLAMRLQYRMNWVRYEIAMRYERSSGKRAILLQRARDGFAEFLLTGDRQLTIESLMGHGLTSKVLKEYDAATHDFQEALKMGPDAESTAKIRLALTDIYVIRGRIGDALSQTSRLGGASSGELRYQAMFLRAKVLLLAIGKYRKDYNASTRGSYRSEAASTLESLYNVNSYWRSKVVQLIDAGIEDPLEWAAGNTSPFVKFLIASSLRRRGECDEATALFTALLEQGRFVSESHYGVGFCQFHEGRYEEAITELDSFLAKASGDETFLGQAAYLRFKAAESLYLRDENAGNQTAEARYVSTMRDFLDRAPEHPNAYEAWFRLGEWERSQGKLIAAAEAFAKVEGDPAFHLKAAFQSAQTYFEAVVDQAKTGTPDPALVETTLASLDSFVAEAGAFREKKTAGDATDGLTAPLIGKAVVMGAGIAANTDDGMKDRLARLKDFETRYPTQSGLFAEVTSLRVVAYRKLGDLESAGGELERLLKMDGAGGYQGDALKKLGVVFLKEAAVRDEAGDTTAAASIRRTALRIYERLLADARAGGDGQAQLEGLEKLVADLRAQAGG